MKPEILQMGPIMARIDDELASAYVVHRYWEAADKATLLREVGPRVRGIATTGGIGAGRSIIEACPKLEIISCFGVGVDAIDTALAKSKGIPVTNTPDVLTDDVADLAIVLLISALRRIPQGDRFVREGRWPKDKFALATSAAGKKLGIIGMGRIGQAIAARALAMNMKISWHGPRPKPGIAYPYHPTAVGIAKDSDVLVLACPGGEATKNIVNRAVIDALGPKGCLVNIARGSVVDEPALLAALQEGRLGSAGLDVFANEPNVPAGFLTLENVVLQPHVGSATHETRGAMGDLVVNNLAAHFAGKPLLTPFN